ncbi:MAG: MFS transporter, partial [SAR202 cluster bacterium]|nr:MFS transporter [SAR202 cluster bacterium]
GIRYLNRNRGALYLVGVALLVFVLGQPYQQVFVPVLALDVLHVGRSGAGWMLALTGVGALLGSLTVATKGHLPRRGLIMLGMLMLFSLSLILLGQSSWLPLSIAALLLAGSMTTTYMALNNSLLLEGTPPEFHGRVMSLMSLDRGLISIGAIVAGALAQLVGPQLGLTIMAGACLTLAVLIFIAVPVLRRLD